MPVGGGFTCGCGGGSDCPSQTTPVATTGLCLPDGTPLAVIIERDCAGTTTQAGWLNLATGAYTTGVPPAGAVACGTAHSIQVSGVFCDLADDGTVYGLVLTEYHYADDGSIDSVRLVSAATGETYALQGALAICPGGEDEPGQRYEVAPVPLCVIDTEGGGGVLQRILAEIVYDAATGERTGVRYVDQVTGAPVALPGGTTIAVCPDTDAEACASSVTTLRLCDLNPDVAPDDQGRRCATPFLRHLVFDCAGVLVEQRDTGLDGAAYAPVQVVDCGSGGVPALVEVPWNIVGIESDPADAARGLIYTLSPDDDPTVTATVAVHVTSNINSTCPATPPSYAVSNPCTYTFTPDPTLQDVATYVRVDLLDFDSFEPVSSLNPRPDRLGGTAVFSGSNVIPTVSNGVGEMYYDGPPAQMSYRVGNTGGGTSCSALSFAAVSLKPEGCCGCTGDGGGADDGRTVQELCVISTAAPDAVQTWTRVIEADGTTVFYLDPTGARYDTTLPAGFIIVACAPPTGATVQVIPLCDTALDGEVTAFLRHVVADDTGATTTVTDTTLDGTTPYTPVGTVRVCAGTGDEEESPGALGCVRCETLTLCDVQPDEDESPGEGTEVPWTTVSVVEDPATAPAHTDFIFTISPQDDPSVVGTVHVSVSRAAGGACGAFDIDNLVFSNTAQYHLTLDPVAQQVDYLRVDILDFDGFEPVAILTGTPEPTRLGGTAEWNGDHDRIIPTEDNGTGELYWDNPPPSIAYEVFNTGGGTSCSRLSFAGVTVVPPPPPPAAGAATPFLRTTCRDCDGTVLTVTDTTTDGSPYTPTGVVTVCGEAAASGQVAADVVDCGDGGRALLVKVCAEEDSPGPDIEVLPLCDRAEDADPVPFLRHLVYTDGTVPPTVLDTELDGVTPYVLAGDAVDCSAAEPCRDSSSTLLCDTSAADFITVFDPANRPDDDGWEVVSFTGYHADAPPEAPLPYPARYGTPYGYPALGARADQYGGYGGGSWAGYDTAPVRWVLRKEFTAPEDGVAVAQSVGFRGDGGARVRINGLDAGMYGQWNQPATSGTAEIPVTAGANTVEIEVRDVNGINNVVGRLDIALPKTVQFMRRQVTDCETGQVVSTTDTTLDGQPYEVTGEVGQCTPAAECCEQPPPELRVDVESGLVCIQDAGGEITGQVLVERVYDDQTGDRVVQRLADPTTGDEVTLPDGAELVLCQEPACPVAFSTECVGAVTRTEAGYDNTSLIGGVPGQCGSVQGPNGQFPCQPTSGGYTIISWIVDGEEVIGEGGGRAFDGGPCGEGVPGNLGMHHNWALALTNLDPSGAAWSAQSAEGCAWFVGSTGGAQTVYGPMTVVDAAGQQWILGPAQACDEVQYTKVFVQECDGTVSVSWLDSEGVATDPPEGDLVPCGTGCGAGGGVGLDVEVLTLCDLQDDGATVAFLRHLTYGSAGQVAVVVDTALDAFAPYTVSGTVTVCQPEGGQDVELLPMCVLDDATGNPIQQIVAEVRYDAETGERAGVTYVDPLTWGPVALPGGSHLGVCPDQQPAPDVELQPLCDVQEDGSVVPFLRHFVYPAGATAPTVLDTALDGATPYAATGTVGMCDAAEPCRNTTSVLLCDLDSSPAGGDGTPSLADDPTPHRNSSVPGLAHLAGGGQALWDGGTLAFPGDPDGSAGNGGQVNRWVNATLTAAAPGCDDGTGTATVTVSVDVTPDDWACGGFGYFAIFGPDGSSLANSGVGLGDRGPIGAGETLTRTLSAEVSAADLAAGRIVVWLNLRTFVSAVESQTNGQGAACTAAANGPLGWTANNFTVSVEQHPAQACSTQFLRHVTVDCTTGQVTAVSDSTLDGDPYTVAGEIGQCTTATPPAPETPPCPAQVIETCRYDDTDGDGVADASYVELIGVDCDGTLTSLGTYTQDLTEPYTPVAPVEPADEGADPATYVEPHRIELGPGQTWDASTVALLQAVTATAHGGTGQITTTDGTSTLFDGESVSWSVARDTDAALTGPLVITAGPGTVTVSYTRTTAS